jgi:hypothetical protein
MVAAAVIAAVCSFGVAFYIRFLVALCKEWRHQPICYFVRLQADSLERIIPAVREPRTSIRRAA